jgi:hypothetical protein
LKKYELKYEADLAFYREIQRLLPSAEKLTMKKHKSTELGGHVLSMYLDPASFGYVTQSGEKYSGGAKPIAVRFSIPLEAPEEKAKEIVEEMLHQCRVFLQLKNP